MFVAALLVLALNSVALAQYYGGFGDYPYGGGYGHASTVQEGAQRGFADVVRSAGYANLKNAQAANINQDTYSKYLDNRLQRTQTYFENRKMNKAYRAELNGPKPTQEQLIRYAQEGVPDRAVALGIDLGGVDHPDAGIEHGIQIDDALAAETYDAFRRFQRTQPVAITAALSDDASTPPPIFIRTLLSA